MKYFYLIIVVFFWINVYGQKADLVLIKGNIITLKFKFDSTQAIAIKGEKIIAVGSGKYI